MNRENIKVVCHFNADGTMFEVEWQEDKVIMLSRWPAVCLIMGLLHDPDEEFMDAIEGAGRHSCRCGK